MMSILTLKEIAETVEKNMKFPKSLNVAVVPKPHIFHISKTEDNAVTIVGGIEKNFLELISHHLRFHYNVQYPADGGWGVLHPNGTWSGIVGLVVSGKSDIGMGRISLNEQRTKYVDYSYPYNMEDLTFATRKPRVRPESLAFISPFDSSIWTMVMILIITISICIRFIVRRDYYWSHIFLKVSASLLKQSPNFKSETFRERVLVASWLFGTMMLSTFYSSVFLSFATVPVSPQGISTVIDLSEAVTHKNLKCFSIAGAGFEHSFISSGNSYLTPLGKKIKENSWFIEPSRELASLTLSDYDSAVISPRYFFTTDSLKDISVSKDSFFSLTRVIILSKKFCCKRQLDSLIHRIVAAGLYQKWLDDQVYFVRHERTFEIHGWRKPLKLSEFWGAFTILLTGYALSVFSFAAEKIFFKLNIIISQRKLQKKIKQKY